MKKRISLLIAAVCLLAAGAYAQGLKSLRINEVMVENDSSIVDDFGHRTAWIELFNANFAPLQISSVYISTNPEHYKHPDKRNKKDMYAVPLGDPRTKMAKRGHVVFFADGEPERGTFHTNFVLTPGKENWIGLFAADGETLIDAVTVPASLTIGQSYAREKDGADTWQVRSGDKSKAKDYLTPGAPNEIRGSNDKIDRFANQDKNGFAMTLMAMGIVFSALLILCLCFYAIGSIGKYFSRVNKARATGTSVAEIAPDDHDSGEEIAAIVMALHEHLNAHDTESTVLTINKVKRAYSPWSSKIYGLREIPRK